MHTSLANKIKLVTGVSSGIGREIAQLLAERGARVTNAILPGMRQQGYGRIVNISSVVGCMFDKSFRKQFQLD